MSIFLTLSPNSLREQRALRTSNGRDVAHLRKSFLCFLSRSLDSLVIVPPATQQGWHAKSSSKRTVISPSRGLEGKPTLKDSRACMDGERLSGWTSNTARERTFSSAIETYWNSCSSWSCDSRPLCTMRRDVNVAFAQAAKKEPAQRTSSKRIRRSRQPPSSGSESEG
jgi:hypothetical protein